MSIYMSVKERPILFSGPMVRAILEGRKTQTRRIINGKGTWSVEKADDFSSRKWPGYEDEYGTWTDMECPYGYPTDRLWVRETWAPMSSFDPSPETGAVYKADDHPSQKAIPAKWRPSIHMPRWASRINLEIVDVRVERLNDISEEDAIAEGCQCAGVPVSLSNVGAFAKLWESINGERSWKANPWVWVVNFKKVD